MKKVLFIMSLIAMMCSCGESYTPNQEIAIALAKNDCISPSSFQLVQVGNDISVPEEIKYDTAYFLNGRQNLYKTSRRDSMVVKKITRSAHNLIRVEYDAQNVYGTMVRGSRYIHLVNGLQTEEIVCTKSLN